MLNCLAHKLGSTAYVDEGEHGIVLRIAISWVYITSSFGGFNPSEKDSIDTQTPPEKV